MFKRKGEGTTIDDFEGFGFGDAVEIIPEPELTMYHMVWVHMITGKELRYEFHGDDSEAKARAFVRRVWNLAPDSISLDDTGLGGFARNHVVYIYTREVKEKPNVE